MNLLYEAVASIDSES